MADGVRYINSVEIGVGGSVRGVFIVNGKCHLFMQPQNSSTINWYSFNCRRDDMYGLLDRKQVETNLKFMPQSMSADHDISSAGWLFKLVNRDVPDSQANPTPYAIHCRRT